MCLCVCVVAYKREEEGYLWGLEEVTKIRIFLLTLGDQVVNKYGSKGTFVISRHM